MRLMRRRGRPSGRERLHGRGLLPGTLLPRGKGLLHRRGLLAGMGRSRRSGLLRENRLPHRRSRLHRAWRWRLSRERLRHRPRWPAHRRRNRLPHSTTGHRTTGHRPWPGGVRGSLELPGRRGPLPRHLRRRRRRHRPGVARPPRHLTAIHRRLPTGVVRRGHHGQSARMTAPRPGFRRGKRPRGSTRRGRPPRRWRPAKGDYGVLDRLGPPRLVLGHEARRLGRRHRDLVRHTRKRGTLDRGRPARRANRPRRRHAVRRTRGLVAATRGGRSGPVSSERRARRTTRRRGCGGRQVTRAVVRGRWPTAFTSGRRGGGAGRRSCRAAVDRGRSARVPCRRGPGARGRGRVGVGCRRGGVIGWWGGGVRGRGEGFRGDPDRGGGPGGLAGVLAGWGHHGSSNSPALAPSTKASHSDSVKTRTVSSGPVNLELRMAM